jgi:pimeloyl-ACP methyl ester carboxylesterase
MPILRINAVGARARLVRTDHTDQPLADAVAGNLGGAPVLIMLHGYRYSPSRPRLSPHNYILQDSPHESWPHQMGYGEGTPDQGLCIAFGWEAGGTIWRAHREAGRSAHALAGLISQLSAYGAGPVNIMAHSLGARVALAALPHLAPGMIGRMILMTGAELRSTAEAALMTSAGRSTQVLNVISRENDVFDFLYEWLLVPHRLGARTLGAGLALPHCVTAQIDNPDHLSGLEILGFPIPIATRRICHWSSYTRPGLFPLYREFLSGSDRIDLAHLRQSLPITVTQRWSRLLQHPLQPIPIAVQ